MAAAGLGAAGRSAGLALAESAAGEVPSGFTRLRVIDGELTVNGKTANVFPIAQDNGAQGYVGVRGGRFKVAVDNGTRDPLTLHWHGLVLPNGQDGVPYVTQRPIGPGERRLYDFPLV